MTSYLSIKSLNKQCSFSFLKSGFSLIAILNVAACNTIQPSDYSVKDSLYVWSEAFDAAEANKVVTDYQSISSLEKSLLVDKGTNSNVDIIYEDMIDNEIAEIDSSLEKINKELNAIKQQVQVTDASNEITIETPSDEIMTQENPLEAGTALALVNSQVASVADINRIIEENPSAAGTPVEQVLPTVNPEVADLKASKKILLLSSDSNYKLDTSEYGMWDLAKSDDSSYQEICSLSSSTMQTELKNYSTQVWLRVVGNGLLVNSSTNIDVYQPRVGLNFDNGSFQAFNKSYFNTSAIWSGDLEKVLKNNKQLRINLGGNELGGRIQEITVNLKDLKMAYSEYQKCNSGTQIGRL